MNKLYILNHKSFYIDLLIWAKDEHEAIELVKNHPSYNNTRYEWSISNVECEEIRLNDQSKIIMRLNN